MSDNPYAAPVTDDPAAGGDGAARRSKVAAVCSLSLAGSLILVGLAQVVVWTDHLENASMSQLSPEYLRRETALARAGGAATLFHVALGVALIAVGVGQLRRRSWSRSAALATGAVGLVAGGGLGVTLHQLGESPPKSWLFLFAPAALVGVVELLLNLGRGKR